MSRTNRENLDFCKVADFFRSQTICCFTSDIDWSPEWAIQEMLATFENLEVPLTLFITHHSETVKQQYGQKGRFQYVGLHPNFLPSSSHGASYIEQIDYCQRLWPEAKCFRSHKCFDNYLIAKEFHNRGFRYDSNLCLFLQPYCTPLHHCSGMVRFPIFWEDDVHSEQGFPFKTEAIRNHLNRPGLKVFNFHPLSFSLNTPTTKYYLSHKFLYEKKDVQWHRYVFEGVGERTFLMNLVAHLKKKRTRLSYLDDLYNELPTLTEG